MKWRHEEGEVAHSFHSALVEKYWRRARDLSSLARVIPRFLGIRVIKDKLAFLEKKGSGISGH